MKKFLLLLTLLCFLVPSIAGAENSKWINPNVSFSKFAKINLVSINVADNYNGNYYPDEYAPEKIANALQKAFNDKGLRLSVADSNYQLINPNDMGGFNRRNGDNSYRSNRFAPLSELDLEVVARKFGYQSRHIPGREEPRTRTVKERVKDNNGNWIEKERQETIYVWVPARDTVDSYVYIAFNLIDPETGTLVFSFTDDRSRPDEDNLSGMLGRMSALFTKELLKVARK